MVVQVNDKKIQVKSESPTIQDVIDEGSYKTRFFVVYLNDEFIPRMHHHRKKVSAGDRLTVYPLVDGG